MRNRLIISIILTIIIVTPVIALSAEKIVVKDSQGVTRFLVDDQGNVGVGTTTPQAALDTAGGDITVNGADDTGFKKPGLSVPVTGELGKLNVGWGGSGGANIDLYSKGHATRPGSFYFIYGGGDFGELRYIHYDGTNYNTRMAITKEGYLGLNRTYPTYPIHLGGGAYTDGYDWYPASSREYKENIKALTVDEAKEALKGLNPVTFNYKADTKDTHVGFIAEEVPELVATKERKGLSAMEVVAVLTGVVKEQQRMIEELKEELKEVKKELRLKGSIAQTEIK